MNTIRVHLGDGFYATVLAAEWRALSVKSKKAYIEALQKEWGINAVGEIGEVHGTAATRR